MSVKTVDYFFSLFLSSTIEARLHNIDTTYPTTRSFSFENLD